ncbi:unnamed protein product [Candidula unifasciata]|uniref:Transmembrane protein 220 n=1 Tax=Candidula unifasciata TaxID=100452 RepID=A0A8S3ZD16_9EUPU|nr:unnamed protein product [Candidula unifasciata]
MLYVQSANASQSWRVFNVVMCVFFSLAAYVNFNDDDWYIWVPIYTVPALLSASVAMKPSLAESTSWNKLVSIDFILCSLYSLYQLFALFKKMPSNNLENPLIHEEGREMGGLLVILAWAGIARYMSPERVKGIESSQRAAVIIFWFITFLASIPLLLWSLCFIDDWHKDYGHCNGMFQK